MPPSNYGVLYCTPGVRYEGSPIDHIPSWETRESEIQLFSSGLFGYAVAAPPSQHRIFSWGPSNPRSSLPTNAFRSTPLAP
jgi:hypothetical protein